MPSTKKFGFEKRIVCGIFPGPNPTTGKGRRSPFDKRATMLILTLKEDEKILIGDKITVMVVEIRGKQIRLGIEAPAGLLVLREKLAEQAKV
jgi:carbon storage regulator